MATERQLAYIRRLLDERKTPPEYEQSVRLALARADADPDCWRNALVSRTIDTLLGFEKRTSTSETTTATSPARSGLLDLRPLIGAQESRRYAVEDPTAPHGVRLLRIDTPLSGKWAGYVFVKDGDPYSKDDERRWGTQSPHYAEIRILPDAPESLRSLLPIVVADPIRATTLYGEKTGSCGVCGRPLTDPESVARGIGPICAAAVGLVGAGR